MKYIAVFVLTLMLSLTIGCANQNEVKSSSSEVSNVSTANYTEKSVYPNGLPDGEPISIADAIAKLKDKLKPADSKLFDCTSIDFINGKAYYLIRGFEDYSDRQVTVGWYAVDVFTGEAFNTNGQTDLVKIP